MAHHVLHTEASLGWGGQEIRILRESQGLMSRGYRVTLAVDARGELLQRARQQGMNVHAVTFSLSNPSSFMRLRSLIVREGVTIVNTHSSRDSWVAGLAARSLRGRVRLVRTRHLSVPISTLPLSRFLYDTLPDAVMTTGESIRLAMIERNGYRGEKIRSIPTGVDLDEFDPEHVGPAFREPGLAVGMVSVLRSWKGHEYFIDAMPEILAAVPETTFFIVGDGPQRERIKSLIDERGLEAKVVMLGHREDVPGVLQSLDILVHPSYAGEGIPQSVLQAMAMRKPVVGTDVGAVGEVVRDGVTGILIPPRSPRHISDAVKGLAGSPERRRQLGGAARRLVADSYSYSGMLDAIEELYSSFTGRDT